MRIVCTTRFRLLATIALSGALLAPLDAQELSVVAVDESPTAHLLVQRVLDQSEDNVGEAARLCAELIEAYGPRLVPTFDSDPDLFTTVRRRVEEILLERPVLLARFSALQDPLAMRRLEIGNDADVIALSWLTRSGLQASLARAQVELESGYISRARRRLERLAVHPDLQGKEAAYRQLMLGFAAHLDGDIEGAQEAANSLSALDESAVLADRLATLQSTLEPIGPQAIGTLDSHHPPPPTGRGWHPVWSGELDTSIFAQSRSERIEDSAALARLHENERQSASSLTAVPLVAADLVYVHDGSVVRAFDRFGADAGWSSNLGDNREQVRRSGLVVDLGELAIEGDALIVLSGAAFTTGRTRAAAVMRLDARDGSPVWHTQIDGLQIEDGPDENTRGVEPEMNLAGAFPYGNPIVESGNVIVSARKVNSRREMVLYLIALDLETGDPSWIRMLGSSSGVRTSRGFSRIFEHDGSIIISSPIGVLARVDPTSGEPLWVKRFPVPLSGGSMGVLPWEIGQAAVLGSDLYAVSPDTQDVVRLDFETGRLLQRWSTGPGTSWGSVKYMVADEAAPLGPTIYAIGEDVIALSGDAPGSIRWQLSEIARDEISSRVGSSSRQGIRGRVHVAGDRLLLPGIEDVLIVDAANGRVIESVPIPGASNPVLLDSQIVLAGLDRIDSLMQLEPAEKLLRARIAEDPDDPSRPLGLLELGIQAERPALALEAAQAAAVAIRTRPDEARMRETLVSMLLRLQAMTAVEAPESATTAIELAETVARTSEQMTSVALALGDLHAANSSPGRAVRTWLELMDDPTLANQLISVPEGVRRAHILVADRLRESAASESTTALVELWEEEAVRALEQMPFDDVVKLEEMARTHGNARGATDAWRRAATIHEREQRWNAATQAMLAAVRARPQDAELRAETAELLLRAGWHHDATQLLENALQERVLRVLAAESLSNRIEHGFLPIQERPELGMTSGNAYEYAGRLLATPTGGLLRGGDSGPTAVLSLIDRTLQCRRLPDSSEPDWEAELPGRSPQLLKRDDASLMIWSRPQLDTPVALVLSMEDGRELWRSPPVEESMPVNGVAPRGRRTSREGLMPGGGVFHARAVEPVLSGHSLVMVRRTGDVASIEIDPTQPVGEVRWTQRDVLDRVYELAANDRMIALGGAVREVDEFGESSEEPKLVILDAESGVVRAEFAPYSGESIRWIQIVPQGLLLVGTRSGVEAFPTDGSTDPLWVNSSTDAAGTAEVVLLGDRLIASRPGASLVALRLKDGSVVPGAFALPDSTRWTPSGLVFMEADSEGLTALFDQRLIRFDLAGAITGVDVIGGERTFTALVPTRRFDLVIDEQSRDPNDGSYRYWIHRFVRDEGCRLAGRSLELRISDRRLDYVEVVDGWLLLSTGTTVLVVPLPPESGVVSEPLEEGA